MRRMRFRKDDDDHNVLAAVSNWVIESRYKQRKNDWQSTSDALIWKPAMDMMWRFVGTD